MEDSECRNCTSIPDIATPGTSYSAVGETAEVPLVLQDLWSRARDNKLERLTPTDCFNQYTQSIQSKHRNLLLVARDDKFPSPENSTYIPNSRVYYGGRFTASSATESGLAANSYAWVCSNLNLRSDELCANEVERLKKQGLDNWAIGQGCTLRKKTNTSSALYYDCHVLNNPVEYCLSERAEPHCKLQFEPHIAIIVTILNFGR